jgi:hypothetical protein
VWLYPSTTPSPGPLGAGRTAGVLAEGVIRGSTSSAPSPGIRSATSSTQ